MASFSLWEHLLSFISVSWMYRITLVSVRRKTHLRGHVVRGSLGPRAIDPGQARLIQPKSLMSERAARTLAFSSRANVDRSP